MLLTETMSVLGVLVMTKKSFITTEKALGRSWRELLEESMKEASEVEKKNAIERGSFHEGVPVISVSHLLVTGTVQYMPTWSRKCQAGDIRYVRLSAPTTQLNVTGAPLRNWWLRSPTTMGRGS